MSQLGRPNNAATANFAMLVVVVIGFLLLGVCSPQEASRQVFFEGPAIQAGKPLKLGGPSQASEQSDKNRLLLKQNKASGNERLNLVEADENGLYLLGLFDIHHSNLNAPFKCGPIDIDAGERRSRRPIQNLEAFLWAIEQVNADQQLLPGIKLGSLVLDTCSSFLRTNQQLANLLHQQPADGLPGARQLMAVVADNQDWDSVEAVASISSAVGLSTFVTQSRSTKLAELARRYSSTQSGPTQSQDTLLGRHQSDSSGGGERQLEGLLGELLGVGKMLPPTSDLLTNLTTESLQREASNNQQQHRLYMIRMLVGNEILADSIASLCQQMNWDLVSLVYDDELDMVDLHDELARQLLARNIQLALDEQIPLNAPADNYSKLVQRLASKTQIGSRVVLTLLGTGSARQLLESFAQLRQLAASSADSDAKLLAKQTNSLLWVTLSDREPYYSLATNALGTVAISNSVSLIPEFKSHFDGLSSDPQHLEQNRWWPEYMQSILIRHRKEVALIANECTKWQEPHAGLLREKCRALSLSDLVRIEQLNLLNSQPPTGGGEAKSNKQSGKQQQQQPKLSKYLAGGWEHNGMDVINSVLAIANGLESVRQTLCPGKLAGICDEMRQIIQHQTQPGQGARAQNSPLANGGGELAASLSALPMMSELIYNELLRSTFQLADGRLFNLIAEDPLLANSGVHQLEAKLKLFNLRYLQPNSIGFVKFGTFDRQDGLIINSTKALHYSAQADSKQQQTSATTAKKSQALKALPLDEIKSSCEDSSKCLMLGQFLSGADELPGENVGPKTRAAGLAISEEELASGLNSLFKLDHPAIVGAGQKPDKQQSDQVHSATANGSGQRQNKQPQEAGADKQQSQAQGSMDSLDSGEGGTRELRWQPALSDHFHWPDEEASSSTKPQVAKPKSGAAAERLAEVVVLLPLHRKAAAGSNRSCGRQLNLDSSFQHLAALAFAGQSLLASSSSEPATPPQPMLMMMNGQQQQQQQQQQARNDSKQIVELTTTVIDYCEQADLAEQKLGQLLARRPELSAARRVAVIDFDESVSRRVDGLLLGGGANTANLLHLTVGSSTAAAANQKGPTTASEQHGAPGHTMHLSLMPSKANEIEALLAVIAAMPQWNLVHLIYTDHHHYRDEFVRRANEANICVSKLIWIPQVSESDGEGAGALRDEEYGRQLEKTKRLFIRELHDYRSNATAAATAAQDHERRQEGLNSTRVLVVLASSLSKNTNRLILEASSESMLEDYVWLTSHEWLWSFSRPNHQSSAPRAATATADAAVAVADADAGGLKEQRWPRHFVSSRFETSHESHEFANFLAQLTPAIHRPLPTDWFDQFWQQKFTCRLPIGSAAGQQPQPQQQQPLPQCSANHRLNALNTRLDDRVHFVIRAMAALHSVLRVADEDQLADRQWMMNNFREQFESIDRHESRPYGFQIVQRLLPADATGSSSSSKKEDDNNNNGRRRHNSRQLDSSSFEFSSNTEDQQQLTRVGIWRDGELTLATRLASASKFDSGQQLPSWLAAEAANQEESGQRAAARIQKSLAQLESIESRCLAEKTCRLCEQQIEQTNKLIQLEEARLSQSQSAAEPKAISSIDADDYASRRRSSSSKRTGAKSSSRKKSSIFDPSSAGSPIEFDGGADRPSLATASSNASVSNSATDDIQAAASSLFDGAVKEQIQLEEQADLRRHFAEQAQWAARARLSSGSATTLFSSPCKHNPALFGGVLLSLAGIICMLYTMTRLYPTATNCSLRQRTKAQTGIGRGSASVYGSEMTLYDRTTESIARQEQAADRSAVLIDYFLLTGLLMLYSINVAFVLPATMSVCWFRRIGLATSYTLIFSSILAQILVDATRKSSSKRKRKAMALQSRPMYLEEDPAGCGGDESEVEVTFESLPPIIDQAMASADAQTPAYAYTNDRPKLNETAEASSGNRGQVDNSLADSHRPQSGHSVGAALIGSSDQGMPMTISMSLLLIQVVVSFVWLIEQPPEPTLYQSCWYCSSPSRSQTLFLYEPLLSLLYPVFVLFLSWISALFYYHVANKSEANRKRSPLVAEGGHVSRTIAQLNHMPNLSYNQHGRLDQSMRRNSKYMLSTTTLLIFTWSIVTLRMISSTNAKLSVPSAAESSSGKQQASDCNTTTLVYANIISGAIVFTSLFLFRLNMVVRCNPMLWRIGRRNGKLSGKMPSSSTASFRSILSNHTAASAGWLTNDSSIDGQLFFTRTISQFTPRADLPASAAAPPSGGDQHERLGLRQFNSYGTYNHGFQFDDVPVKHAEAAPCDSVNPNQGRRRSKRFAKSSTLSRTAIAGSISETAASGSHAGRVKKKPDKEGKLHRRPSAGSVASSTAKLVVAQRPRASAAGEGNKYSGEKDDDGDDTISCASSVASSSTSQLQGNDLYPIDL